MQDGRISGDQLFALEPIDVENRSRAPVKFVQPPFDGVQAADGASIVVLVVARQQPLGKPHEARRLEWQWHDLVWHWVPCSAARPIREEANAMLKSRMIQVLHFRSCVIRFNYE